MADIQQHPPGDVPWNRLWPAPDPADGDGSDHAESTADDGTPGTAKVIR